MSKYFSFKERFTKIWTQVGTSQESVFSLKAVLPPGVLVVIWMFWGQAGLDSGWGWRGGAVTTLIQDWEHLRSQGLQGRLPCHFKWQIPGVSLHYFQLHSTFQPIHKAEGIIIPSLDPLDSVATSFSHEHFCCVQPPSVWYSVWTSTGDSCIALMACERVGPAVNWVDSEQGFPPPAPARGGDLGTWDCSPQHEHLFTWHGISYLISLFVT